MINNPVGADLRACSAHMNENTGSPLQKDLPEGWFWKTMGEISDVIGGGTPQTNVLEYYNDGNIPWITPADLSGYNNKYISHGSRFITEAGLKNSSARLLPAGTVLFTTRAPIGYVAIASNPISTNQGFKSFVLKEGILPDYVYWYLKGNKCLAESYASGTTFLELAGAKAKQIPIPIAPPNEQKLIVAEIEKQFSRLDEAVASLKRVKANLKRYKAAVLKAAVEGKLTEEWRKRHIDVEPASDLLKHILAERKKKWEAEHPGKKYKEPTPPDASKLPELPEGWVWATPEMLAQHEENSICAGPFGTIFKAKDFREEGIPIIFLRHVAPGKYLTYKPGFMDKNKWKELFQPYSVYGGELLITKLGEPPGICAIYPENIGPAMVTPDVIKMTVNRNVARSKYLMYYLNSQIAMRASSELAFGTTRLRLTLPTFRHLPIPVPPLAKQHVIVAEIENRLSVTEEIDIALEINLKRGERLRQSILKKAFSGRLIEHDKLPYKKGIHC